MGKKQGLSKKITRTMLAMSLVYAGGMCADITAEAWNAATTVNTSGSTPINENKIITSADFNGNEDVGLLVNVVNNSSSKPVTVDFNGTIKVDAANSTAAALVFNYKNSSMGTESIINLKNDITVKAAAGHYALLLDKIECGMHGALSVNPDEDKTVQLLGDVGISTAYGKYTLNPHLTNAESYLAGDLKMGSRMDNSAIKLKLANGAVWYPGVDNYTVGGSNNDGYLRFELDSGIIYIYHSQPGEARQNKDSGRTFTVNDVDNDFSGANGTTFRIGSNIGAGWSDKIVLNGKAGIAGTDQYYIQIVADPSIKSADATIDLASQKIVVAQVDGANLTKDNTNFTGKTYEGAEIDAGLTLADMTPELEYDDASGGWIIKKISAENFRANGGEKGSALVLAEAGAANSMNIASAWRGENNDLLRRMGDLRGSSDEAGAWVRMYGGENKVSRGQSTNMT